VKESLLDTFKILTKMPMQPLWTKIQDGGHPQTKSLKMKKNIFFINLASGKEQKLLKKKGKKRKKIHIDVPRRARTPCLRVGLEPGNTDDENVHLTLHNLTVS